MLGTAIGASAEKPAGKAPVGAVDVPVPRRARVVPLTRCGLRDLPFRREALWRGLARRRGRGDEVVGWRRGDAAGGSGAVFPGYGRSKGQPVVGATMGDLEFYASGARRSLGDPAKARFHDKERALLASIEAEIARQSGGGQGQPSGGSGAPEYGGPPPDDDIPFAHCGGIR